ncbi:hypothetical protein FEM48_Zijuj05G0011000 [Ziziphus jujuba var. spinosa]|uniref:Polygalacturonase-like n=1 Tax=Ziziphus jujuba var. spinosa TaxID=714518 RepID=A0A978VBW8_ZIZJJ|nr:hypothetical protein FEM48_Zijuj05G0011000 [Ziziphus jujuba var. spinosa]
MKFPFMKSYKKFPNASHDANNIPAFVLQGTCSISKGETLQIKKYLKIILLLALVVIFLASSSLSSFSHEQEALAISIPVNCYHNSNSDRNIIVGRNETAYEGLLKFESHVTDLYKIISLWFSSANKIPSTKPRIFDVLDFGATGDEIIDDGKEVWDRACTSEDHPVVLVVPNNNYMLKPIKFSGPCKCGDLTMKIKGTIIASQNRSDYKHKEIGLCFKRFTTLKLKVVESLMAMEGYGGKTLIKLTTSGAWELEISREYVSNVVVNRATFSGTTNGLRIKTWQVNLLLISFVPFSAYYSLGQIKSQLQGGSGYAKNIRFQNITMLDVGNPIIIDQYYCDQMEPCSEQVSAVQISNADYHNIKGTSNSEVAIRFDAATTFHVKGFSCKMWIFNLKQIIFIMINLKPHVRMLC